MDGTFPSAPDELRMSKNCILGIDPSLPSYNPQRRGTKTIAEGARLSFDVVTLLHGAPPLGGLDVDKHANLSASRLREGFDFGLALEVGCD